MCSGYPNCLMGEHLVRTRASRRTQQYYTRWMSQTVIDHQALIHSVALQDGWPQGGSIQPNADILYRMSQCKAEHWSRESCLLHMLLSGKLPDLFGNVWIQILTSLMLLPSPAYSQQVRCSGKKIWWANRPSLDPCTLHQTWPDC